MSPPSLRRGSMATRIFVRTCARNGLRGGTLCLLNRVNLRKASRLKCGEILRRLRAFAQDDRADRAVGAVLLRACQDGGSFVALGHRSSSMYSAPAIGFLR